MFYLSEEGWKPFKKSITFKETIHMYDNSDEAYQDKEEMMSADIALNDEQLRRLETIKHIEAMGTEDVKAYVMDGIITDLELVVMKQEVKAEETRQKLARLIRWDELTTEEMMDLIDDFKKYDVGSFYVPGDIFNYNSQLYMVLQSHTSQEDWHPEQTPGLYKPIAPPSVIPEWKQPTGAHDAYNIGDKVTFEGLVYESLIDGNTWSPTAYPQGWKEIVN
jgi:hypothetical protein